MLQKENKQELTVRESLEAQLAPNETLLSYSSGFITALTSNPHHIGLSAERLILLPVDGGKAAGPPISIFRNYLSALRYRGILRGNIRISLPCDRLDVQVRGRGWKKRAKVLVETSARLPPPTLLDSVAASRRALQQVRDFQQLGLLASAQYQLEDAIRVDPALGMNQSVVQGRAQLNETRRMYRLAALFLFGDIVIFAVISLLLALGGENAAAGALLASDVPVFIFDGMIGSRLWRGRTRWRTWAMLRAGLGLLIYGGLALRDHSYLQAGIQASFCLALIVLLINRPIRGREWVAGALYVIGYLGGITLSLALPYVQALFRARG